MAQTYNPSDWSGPTYTKLDYYVNGTGEGSASVATNGSIVEAKTADAGDYAYATATCGAIFAHNVAQSAYFYGVLTGTILGGLRADSYGYSNVSSGPNVIVSDTGQANHNYTDQSPYGFGPFLVSSTAPGLTIQFVVTASCHDFVGNTSAQGTVDKNVD